MQILSRGEQKSLALHKVIAARLRMDPSLGAIAHQRLGWLRVRNPAGKKYHDEWQLLLDGPIDALIDVMVSPSERSCALRQENPFVDLVDQKERARIYGEVAASIDQALQV